MAVATTLSPSGRGGYLLPSDYPSVEGSQIAR
jgi:hypothetical protein